MKSFLTILFTAFLAKIAFCNCQFPLINSTEEWLYENAPRLKGAVAREIYEKAIEAFDLKNKEIENRLDNDHAAKNFKILLDQSLILIRTKPNPQEEAEFEILFDPRFWSPSPDLITSQTSVLTLTWIASGKSSWAESFDMNLPQLSRRSELEYTLLQFWPKEPISREAGLEGTILPRGFSVQGDSSFEKGFLKLDIEEVNFWMSHDKKSQARVPYSIMFRLKVRADIE